MEHAMTVIPLLLEIRLQEQMPLPLTPTLKVDERQPHANEYNHRPKTQVHLRRRVAWQLNEETTPYVKLFR